MTIKMQYVFLDWIVDKEKNPINVIIGTFGKKKVWRCHWNIWVWAMLDNTNIKYL